MYESATNITPQSEKAGKRKFPPLPDTYDTLQWLLIQYIRSGRRLFTQNNRHLQEVQYIKIELMYVYRRNGGYISSNYIAGLLWYILIDTAQYLYTFLTESDIKTNDNLPQKRLYCRESLVSANIYVHPMNAPRKWLNMNSQWKPGILITKPTNDLNTPYTSREIKEPRDKGNQISGNKRDVEHLQTKRSLHPTLEILMRNFHSMNLRSGPVTPLKLAVKWPSYIPKH